MEKDEAKRYGMKRYVRYFLAFFMLSALFVVFGAGVEAAGRTDGVAVGKSVFLHPSGVAFWGWQEEVWSGLVDESDHIYDYLREGSMPSKVQTVAVDGNYLYLDTFKGLFRINLQEQGQDTSVAQQLHDSMLIRGFFVYDGFAYFMSGSTLYRVPVNGGDKEKLASGVEDCEVTQDGIYYTDADGGLFLLALDGSGRNFLTDTAAGSKVVLHDDFIYFWGEDEQVIHQYSIQDASVKTIELQHEFYTTDYIWASDTYFIYNTSSTDGYKYDLTTGQEESLGRLYGLMDKEKGLFCNDKLYYVIGDTLTCYDVAADERSKVKRDEVSGGSSGTNASSENNVSENTSGNTGGQSSSGGYNIAENIGLHFSQGLAFVSSDYFTLYLPEDILWDWEVINDTTVKFFYPAAKDAGFGGTFVTIRAYDWGDNSYSEIPSYRIAGLSDMKKYVAIFPTDVQYDSSDSTQTAEYQRLLEYVYRIDNESSDSPFMVNVG